MPMEGMYPAVNPIAYMNRYKTTCLVKYYAINLFSFVSSVFGSEPIQYPKREFLNDDDSDDKEKLKLKVSVNSSIAFSNRFILPTEHSTYLQCAHSCFRSTVLSCLNRAGQIEYFSFFGRFSCMG